MICGVFIEKPSDHALVLRVVLLSLTLEEVDAALAQCDSDLHSFFSKDKILRSR